MANMITKSDVKTFINLLKIGIAEGSNKELKNYTMSINHDGLDVAKSYYVSIEFRFNCSPESIEKLMAEDSIDNDIKDLLNDIKS